MTVKELGAYTYETQCRACKSAEIKDILSLGNTPLANSLLDPRKSNAVEYVYPLTLALCENCSLVQIRETVDPSKMFGEYLYFSSFSQTMLKHAEDLVAALSERFKLTRESLVMEIASNDGYLLKNYVKRGIPVLGIEPAANIAKFAVEQNQVPTLCEFFGEELAQRLKSENRAADVIHANNVLAHVPDINGVLKGFATLLKEDGVVVTESPYLFEMLENHEFDTIYHEHLFYYSLTAQDYMFKKAGLTIFDFEVLDIHGGSLRVFASRSDRKGLQVSARVKDTLFKEGSMGVKKLGSYEAFRQRTEAFRSELCDLLSSLKAQGARIAAYGASAKGSTLLNYCGVDCSTLDFLADRSTVKQGLLSPGTHIPIVHPDALLKEMPDYVLLLTWNFAKEILEQQEAYRRAGGKFIIPIPEIRIV